MLISTSTKVKHSVELTLNYDDNTSITHNLVVGMKVDITYYKDGKIETGIGTIKELKFPTKYAYNLGSEYNAPIQRAPKVPVNNHDQNFPDTRKPIPTPRPDLGAHIFAEQPNPWYQGPKPQVFLVIDFSQEFESKVVEIADINILTLKQIATSAAFAELFNLYDTTVSTVKNDDNQYTEESFNALTAVLISVRSAIMENPNAGSALISAGIGMINDAITNMVVSGEEPSEDNDESYTDKEIKEGVDNILNPSTEG